MIIAVRAGVNVQSLGEFSVPLETQALLVAFEA
jgi:hypothetical protein